MKSNQTPTSGNPEWDLARNFQTKKRIHDRLRPVFGILLGKESFELKKKLEIEGRGGDRRSNVNALRLKSETATWDEICKRELGITRPTVERYINRYQTALACAETLETADDVHPSIYPLLKKPSAKLTDEDFNTLAYCIDELVDRMTQASLRIDLGLTAEDAGTAGNTMESGDDSNHLETPLEREALIFFSSIPRSIDALKKAICTRRDYNRYAILLTQLPLDNGQKGKPSLRGIKEGLEAILQSGVIDILKDINTAIETKTPENAAKPVKGASARRNKSQKLITK